MRWNDPVKDYDFCRKFKLVFWWDNKIKATITYPRNIAAPELSPHTISTSHQQLGCIIQNFISLWLWMHASLKNKKKCNALCSPSAGNCLVPEFYVILHNILVAPAAMPLIGILPVMSFLNRTAPPPFHRCQALGKVTCINCTFYRKRISIELPN